MSILIPFIIFMIFVALVSWWFTRKDKLDSEDGYFLGGRSLTAPFIAGSLLLTNLSTEHLVGLNGSGYAFGMEVIAWETLAALAMVLLAAYLLPKYLKMGLTTITQYLEIRFDKSTRIIVSGLFLLLYVTTLLPVVLYTGALNLENIFNVSGTFGMNNFNTMLVVIIVIGFIGSMYAIFGGLKAVAVSDTINGIGLILGGVLVPFFAFYQIGDGSVVSGVSEVYDAIPEHFNVIGDSESEVPFSVLFTGMFIPQIFYWTMNQSIIQRALGARSLAEGQKGILIASFFKIFIPIIVVVPGIIAFYYFKGGMNNAFDINNVGLSNSDLAYPELVKAILPTTLMGVFAAVIMGAVLSTFNSALNSASTLFSIDIYKEYINKNASQKRIVMIGKIVATILAVMVMLIAPFIGMLGKGLYVVLQEFSSLFNMPIFAVIVAGLFMKKVSAKGAKIGLVIGALLYVSSKFLLSGIGVEINFLHKLAVAFFITLGIMALASKKYKRVNYTVVENKEMVNLEHWKYLKPVSIIAVVTIVTIYIFLSPIGIG